MLISGKKSLPIFEAEIEVFDILHKKHVRKFDFVHAENEADARKRLFWIHGSTTDILRVALES